MSKSSSENDDEDGVKFHGKKVKEVHLLSLIDSWTNGSSQSMALTMV